MISVDYRFLTRSVLFVNILAFFAFFFLGFVNDTAIFTLLTGLVLALDIFMLFMLSDFKFHKNKNSNEDSQEFDL